MTAGLETERERLIEAFEECHSGQTEEADPQAGPQRHPIQTGPTTVQPTVQIQITKSQ